MQRNEVPSIQPLALSITDACRALSLGRTSLWKLSREGKLRVVKISGRTLVPRSEVERLVREGA